MRAKKTSKTLKVIVTIFLVVLTFHLFPQEDRQDTNIALISAVAMRDIQKINILLANGVDINFHGEAGMTPLIIATYFNYPDVVAHLIKKGADLQATYVRRGCRSGRFTALDIAKKRGYLNIILMLQNIDARM